MGDYLNPNTWKQEAHTIPNPMEWQHADVAKRYAEEANNDAVYVENLMKQIDENFEYVNNNINEINSKLSDSEETINRIASIEQQCMEDAANASAKAIEASQSASLAGISSDAAATSASTAISNAVSAQSAATAAAASAESARQSAGMNGLITVDSSTGVMNITAKNGEEELPVSDVMFNGSGLIPYVAHISQLHTPDILNFELTSNVIHIADWSGQIIGNRIYFTIVFLTATTVEPAPEPYGFVRLFKIKGAPIKSPSSYTNQYNMLIPTKNNDRSIGLSDCAIGYISSGAKAISVGYTSEIQPNLEYEVHFWVPIQRDVPIIL